MPAGVPTLKSVKVGSGQKKKLPVFLRDDANWTCDGQILMYRVFHDFRA